MQIQAADYPLQVEPAQVLGFDCGLGAGLRICIFFGNKTHVGASFILLAPIFLQKSARAHAAPRLQTSTACAGLRFGFGRRPAGGCILFGKQTHLGAGVISFAPTIYEPLTAIPPAFPHSPYSPPPEARPGKNGAGTQVPAPFHVQPHFLPKPCRKPRLLNGPACSAPRRSSSTKRPSRHRGRRSDS